MKCSSLSHVQLFSTPQTVTHQAPLSMGFPGQEYWSELSFPSPGDLPDPGIKPRSPVLQGRFFIFLATREAQVEGKGKSIKKVLPNESSPKLQCEKKSWFIKGARCQTCLQRAEGRTIPPPGESSYQNP